MYKTFVYIALFFVYAFLGWIMEEVKTYPDYKKFVNRGFLIGPILPIYGTGALLITLLINRFKGNVLLLFIFSLVLCSVVEYLTSYIMEKIFKTRWWDYSKRKFNINGRVCLFNMVAFGILGVLLIELINPFVMDIIYKIDVMVLKSVVSLFFILFLIDFVISTKIIYGIKGVGLTLLKDSTEEINEKVKEIIMNKGKFSRRVVKAFPDFRLKLH